MRLVRRKWGFYITLLDRKQFKVKLLRFKPFGKCSEQWHRKRNELWLFLGGKGRLDVGGEIHNKDENLNGKYFLIHRGEVHQYEAYEKTWVLEIQYGSKCEESDIVRI